MYPHYPKIDKLVLSHSSRSSLQGCMRKGVEFKQFYGLLPRDDDDNYAGAVGNAMHEGLGVWLKTNDEEAAILQFLIKFPHKLEQLKATNLNRSLEAAYATFMVLLQSPFLSKYQIAKIKLSDGSVKEAIEVPFAIQIVGAPMLIPVWFVGKIDLIMYDPFRDRYIIIDLKTTRQNFNDYEYRFTYDEQTIPYGIILEHSLGRSIDEFDVIYLSAYVDLIEPKIKHFEVAKTHGDLEDWHYGLCDDIEQIAKYARNARFPRATDGQTCVSWQHKCYWLDECAYRNTDVLAKILPGKIREGLFSDGTLPWITAELDYINGG